MNDPLIVRDVSYYLDWLKDFRDGIEADREEKKDRVNHFGDALRGHPLPEWLVKRATWDGVGVLQFKAANPDWLLQYQASRSNELPPDDLNLH